MVIVDPGEAAPVLAALQEQALTLSAILITHHHWDHVNGLDEILQSWDVPVYGPEVDRDVVPQIQHGLADGDRVELAELELSLEVLAVPGHTLDHIAYFGEFNARPLVFCGDTLFSAGCGRLFEGDPAMMHTSIQRLAALPANTMVCCTHEYTQANLAFALAVEPGNPALQAHRDKVTALRKDNQPSLPSSIGLEQEINPFMRCHLPCVQQAAARHSGREIHDAVDTFAAIRAWKDNF